MQNYLLLYRSLTQAQKASAALDRAGIPNRVVRAPKAVSGEGCSHCVRFTQEPPDRALEHLRKLEQEPRRVYATVGEGKYEEVLF